MARDAADRVQTDGSAFSVMCFAPSDQVTALRAYRVKVSQGGPKGYKSVVLDISPDLPIQQKLMRVYECEGENRTQIEMDVLREIRDRHPDLLVRRHPAQRDPHEVADEPAAAARGPAVSSAPAAATPPPPVAPPAVSSPPPAAPTRPSVEAAPSAAHAPPVAHARPDSVSTASDTALRVPMSLNEARRTATMIAHDSSHTLSVEESVRNLAKVLATVLTLIAEVVDDDADAR